MRSWIIYCLLTPKIGGPEKKKKKGKKRDLEGFRALSMHMWQVKMTNNACVKSDCSLQVEELGSISCQDPDWLFRQPLISMLTSRSWSLSSLEAPWSREKLKQSGNRLYAESNPNAVQRNRALDGEHCLLNHSIWIESRLLWVLWGIIILANQWE